MHNLKNIPLIAFLCLSGILLFTACNNSSDDDDSPEVTIPPDALYYFVGTVDGVEQKIIVTLTNENINYYSNNGSIGVAELPPKIEILRLWFFRFDFPFS